MNLRLTTRQAEWDKYFPIEQNTGDLNIPDFNFADFTGAYSGAPMDASSFATTGSSINIPSAQDLADVNFTTTYYPEPVHSQQQNLQNLYNS